VHFGNFASVFKYTSALIPRTLFIKAASGTAIALLPGPPSAADSNAVLASITDAACCELVAALEQKRLDVLCSTPCCMYVLVRRLHLPGVQDSKSVL
jgi:hypothetical protein